MKPRLEVIKLNAQAEPVWSYPGALLAEGPTWRIIEAFFDRGPTDLGLIQLKPRDRMVEHFYSDRWYNIFEIYRATGELVGWYCNIARPAVFTFDSIKQEDLALDFIVNSQGESAVLDQVEFAALQLSSREQSLALNGLKQLQQRLAARTDVFQRLLTAE